MQLETRKIQVTPGLEVSSLWAFPRSRSAAIERAVILAHGAGHDMAHPFIDHFHRSFAEADSLCVKFNFPYREFGRKAPDRMGLLENTWRAVIAAVRDHRPAGKKPLFLAGKSMGGRVASHVAAAGEPCAGLVCLGYPLHPSKQPGKLRVDHWSRITCPVLFVQGTRDTLCDLDMLELHLPRITGPVAVHRVEGGDHSLKAPAALGQPPEENWAQAAAAAVAWMEAIGGGT